MREIDIRELKLNPFTDFNEDWMLLSAGKEKSGYNTMTISWGHMGSIWGRSSNDGWGLPTVVCYVRPSRYTKEFVDKEEFFTVSHFAPEHKKDLAYLGSYSGRDEDKLAKTGLTPIFEDNTVFFEQADYVLICRKIYRAPILEEGFMEHDMMERNYPKKDFHDFYIGEIVKVLVK